MLLPDSKAAKETNPLSSMESLHNGQSKEAEYCNLQLRDCVPRRTSSAVLAQVNFFIDSASLCVLNTCVYVQIY